MDNARAEAALQGTATETHIVVHFYGNFEKLAKPLFNALKGMGFNCFSAWDRKIINTWPKSETPRVDKGFVARMMRVIQRRASELRETVADADERTRILGEVVKSPEFRAQMADEERLEASRQRR